MAKRIFYRKRRGLPEWAQIYFVWAVAVTALSPFAFYCGTQKIEKVEALALPQQPSEMQPIDLKLWKVNPLLQNSADFKSLVTALSVNQKLLKIKTQKIDLGSYSGTHLTADELCLMYRVSHEKESLPTFSVMNFATKESFGFYRAYIDTWLKNLQAGSQLILASSSSCYTPKALSSVFTPENARNVIFLEHSSVYKKSIVYYGRAFSLPNIVYAATLKKIQPFSIWEHILANFIDYAVFPHAVLLDNKVNSFTVNAAAFFKQVAPDTAADFIEKLHSVSQKLPAEEQPTFKLWLTQQRQLGDMSIKFFYIFLFILLSLPLVVRLNQRANLNLVPALVSTLMFSLFTAIYFVLANFLANVSASLLLYVVFIILVAIAVFITAKFFERKFLLLVIDTTSAYTIVLALMLWLFFSDIHLFLFFLPVVMVFAQLKDSPANLTLMLLMFAIGLPLTVVIVALNYLFGLQTDAKTFFSLIDFNLHRFILFALLGGALLTLASKNTRPKKYF